MRFGITVITTMVLIVLAPSLIYAQNVFSVKGNKTFLNEREFRVIGLRCANALISDESAEELIHHLDEYKSYGLNTISVYFMGSRYSDIHGFNIDGTINAVYGERMSRIVRACDQREMVVLVGILYWGSGETARVNEFYSTWGQKEANAAIRNTVEWLRSRRFRNVFLDPDNEGMAEGGAHFDIDQMICEAKKVDPGFVIAYNSKGYPPPCADMSIHFGFRTSTMPYIESEGTPDQYWLDYSKERDLLQYINVGVYTEGKKRQQLERTKEILDKGYGYMFASTWLQNVPPNFALGGNGTAGSPGVKWWCEFVRDNYGRKQ